MTKIDFFFDFMSPFGYLAHHRLPALAARYGATIDYKPIDLPAAKVAAGNTGPSNRAVPVKLRYLHADQDRWAVRYGVPIVRPVTLTSTRANKGTFYAAQRGQATEYVSSVWQKVWGEGRSMSDDSVLNAVAADMGWPASELLEFTLSAEAERRYEESNQEAHERGVFGVPIMMIGTEMWWGNDRLQFLEDYLSGDRAERVCPED
jgi:2-hydroxychromene-2-carboxylate isomerase